MIDPNLSGRDLITTQDWSVDEINSTIKLAKKFKSQYPSGRIPRMLGNKTFFMLFYSSSTRTRAAFEAGMTCLGGHAQYIDVSTTRLGAGEAPKDVAKMYERYGHALGVRILDEAIDYVYGRGVQMVREYAAHADIPVINMACCTYHPTQGLADLMSVDEALGRLKGKKHVIMWGYSKSFRGRCSIQEEALIMTRYGMDVVLAHPPEFEIDSKILDMCRMNSDDSGGSITVATNLESALNGAHVIFPRNWASKGLLEAGASRYGRDRETAIHEKYSDWRLTMDLLDRADSKAIITHVLPVLRGEEATDDVMDSERSVIYAQAENGLYTKMAVLAQTMSGKKRRGKSPRR